MHLTQDGGELMEDQGGIITVGVMGVTGLSFGWRCWEVTVHTHTELTLAQVPNYACAFPTSRCRKLRRKKSHRRTPKMLSFPSNSR